MPAEPWYRDGLRFECTRCGNCCSGPPGTVHVSPAEETALAEFLDLPLPEFRAMYTRTLPGGTLSLREYERDGSHDCVFWDAEAGCRVYAHRPRQCRTWPFWRGTVETPAHWKNTAATCPGIGSGALHDLEAIHERIADDGTLGTKPDLG